MKKNKKTKPSRFKNFLFVMFWLLILGSFTVLIVEQANGYNRLHSDMTRIRQQIDAEEAIANDLNNQIHFFDNDAHIERLARERLGMVRPDELLFRNTAVD